MANTTKNTLRKVSDRQMTDGHPDFMLAGIF